MLLDWTHKLNIYISQCQFDLSRITPFILPPGITYLSRITDLCTVIPKTQFLVLFNTTTLCFEIWRKFDRALRKKPDCLHLRHNLFSLWWRWEAFLTLFIFARFAANGNMPCLERLRHGCDVVLLDSFC